jgi:hypothetical protein
VECQGVELAGNGHDFALREGVLAELSSLAQLEVFPPDQIAGNIFRVQQDKV